MVLLVGVRELEVTVLNRQRGRRVSIPVLKRFIHRVIERVPPGSADRMAVCLVSDDAMRRFNREFRGIPRSTDVLSFPGDEFDLPDGGRHLGDIVISVPRAARQARDRGHSFARELKLLLIHGYLHLVGYDHERDGGKMMNLQRRLVRTLLPRTTHRTR